MADRKTVVNFEGVIVQAAPHIEAGAGVAGVANALNEAFQDAGVRAETFTLREAGGGWIPKPRHNLPKKLALVLEVVWFTFVGGWLLRRLGRRRPDVVVITHNDALAGDVYVNHGVLKASLQVRGRLKLRLLRNPLHLFVLARDGWRYRSRIHRTVVALTRAEATVLRETYPRLSAPVEVIPNGVDIVRFAPAEATDSNRQDVRSRLRIGDAEQVVLFVGHEFDRKGLNQLIDGLALCREGIRLLVVGGTPEMIRSAGKLVDRAGVTGRVDFVGLVGDPGPYFAAADVFCLPSAYEANALVVLEALACGLPVVATRVGFAPDVIEDAVNGVLIERNPADIARGITAIADAPDRPWADSARASALHHSWTAVAAQYAALARKLQNEGTW